MEMPDEIWVRIHESWLRDAHYSQTRYTRAPEWVKVSERLPDKAGPYQVCVRQIRSQFRWRTVFDFSSETNEWICAGDIIVEHWAEMLPLPPPPEGEKP